MNKFIFIAFLAPVIASAQNTAVETVCIENAGVAAYLADKTYDTNNDYNTTVILNYATDTYLQGTDSLDVPMGKEITWQNKTSAAELQQRQVLLSFSPLFFNADAFSLSDLSASHFTVYNLLPGKTYYYRVEETLLSGDKQLLAFGSFKTTGQERMIKAEGAMNTRDMGGWPTAFNVPVRYGKLFRSTHLHYLSDKGREALADRLNIQEELDIMSSVESAENPSKLGVGYKHICLGNYDWALTRAHTLNVDSTVKAFKWVISELRKGTNVDFHCSAGCDRAGTFAWLLEGVLGLSEADLCRDYELSQFFVMRTSSTDYRTRTNYLADPNLVNLVVKASGTSSSSPLNESFYQFCIKYGMTAADLDFFRLYMLDWESAYQQYILNGAAATEATCEDRNTDKAVNVADILRLQQQRLDK